ncbi:MAG: hypothetical protein M1156_00165 [Candidatus Marsarchaeota archaeon]|jgi:ribosomal protein L31E|nr:hypothetical protein [Candidatus Marsarchaeota archaeon]
MATTITRTVSLRKRLVRIHTTRRLKKSVDYLREDIARHAKVNVSAVKLSQELGSYVVSRVSRRMVPVKITVEKSGDIVKADLAQELKRKPKAAPAPAGKSAAEQKKQAPAANAAASQPSKGTAKQTDASKKAASTPQKPAGGKTAPTGSTDKKVS